MAMACRILNTCRRDLVDLLFCLFSIMVLDITISCRSFVFSQSRGKVSAGLTNVSGLAVAAFDYLSIVLFVCPSVCLNGLDNSEYV